MVVMRVVWPVGENMHIKASRLSLARWPFAHPLSRFCKFQRKREREMSLKSAGSGYPKREIFQRRREISTDFQRNREISSLSMNSLEKVKLRRLFAVITLFLWL